MPHPRISADRSTPAGLACVVNLSEGRDTSRLDRLRRAAGPSLIDLHHDQDHNRSVLTLGHRRGAVVEDGVRTLVAEAIRTLDLRRHHGAHPRFGVVDVVPFVPLVGPAGGPAGTEDDLTPAIAARERFVSWAADTLQLPCFVYGPERTLPDVRRRAFVDLVPDAGPPAPHPSAGACAVGARPALVAYNVWLASDDVAAARRIAGALRRPGVRTLGLAVGDQVQVSCNLVDPDSIGPHTVLELVEALAATEGVAVDRAELVGLAPATVVGRIPEAARQRCDVTMERTVESRLVQTHALDLGYQLPSTQDAAVTATG